MGRPRKDNNKNKEFHVRLTEVQLDMLQRQASHHGISMAKLVEKWIYDEDRRIKLAIFDGGNTVTFDPNDKFLY
jgi:hypothetical protein